MDNAHHLQNTEHPRHGTARPIIRPCFNDLMARQALYCLGVSKHENASPINRAKAPWIEINCNRVELGNTDKWGKLLSTYYFGRERSCGRSRHRFNRTAVLRSIHCLVTYSKAATGTPSTGLHWAKPYLASWIPCRGNGMPVGTAQGCWKVEKPASAALRPTTPGKA
jgi:hypothetical protein